MSDDPYADLKQHRWPDGTVVSERRAVVPKKIQRRRRHFIPVPMAWFERLAGASGQTYRVAISLLYLNWREKGGPVKLGNGLLQIDEVSRQSKWRALVDLEHRGLITVERRRRHSPVVRLLNLS
jgi:hypothetical protein